MKNPIIEIEPSWKVFYKFSGIAAFLIVLVGIFDIVLSMIAGEAKANHVVTVTEWFELFQSNRISALSNLGMINLITLTLGIPVYLALINLHRKTNPSFSALSAIFFFIGAAVYFSSNTIFSMLALSNQYATASEVQKPLLEAAGRAALTIGADLTPGTFMGLLFTQLAGVVITFVMLRGQIFSRWTAGLGLFGYICMVIFFTITAFVPSIFYTAMMISMLGGLSLMAYHILFARKLIQLSD